MWQEARAQAESAQRAAEAQAGFRTQGPERSFSFAFLPRDWGFRCPALIERRQTKRERERGDRWALIGDKWTYGHPVSLSSWDAPDSSVLEVYMGLTASGFGPLNRGWTWTDSKGNDGPSIAVTTVFVCIEAVRTTL